jgi:hypothetical protein
MAAQSEIHHPDGMIGSPRLVVSSRPTLLDDDREWPRSNAQVDLWISLLSALGHDPVPALSAVLCADFEGDQWTHTRVGASDLWACYGIDVQDLNVWRPLLAHLVEQLHRGNIVLVDVDAFHLPDTVGVRYQREHVKTLIAVTAYDRNAHRLHYLHGANSATLEGDDLDGLLTAGIGSAQLPPFAQIIKLERMMQRTEAERTTLATALVRLHGTRIPARNPIRAFSDKLREHGAWLAGGDTEQYRKWSYATVQQCGSAFELAADVTGWLAMSGEPVGDAVPHLQQIAQDAKILHHKLIRVPQSGQMTNVSELTDRMAAAWDAAMAILKPRYGA